MFHRIKNSLTAATLSATISLALLSFPARALAALVDTTTNEEVPVASTQINTCNGDVVLLSGLMHVQNHYYTDNTGGSHLESHINYQDVTGVGAPSGSTYTATDTVDTTVNTNQLQSEQTFVQEFNLISHGSAPNFKLRVTFHVTINANGQTTTTVNNTREICNG